MAITIIMTVSWESSGWQSIQMLQQSEDLLRVFSDGNLWPQYPTIEIFIQCQDDDKPDMAVRPICRLPVNHGNVLWSHSLQTDQ